MIQFRGLLAKAQQFISRKKGSGEVEYNISDAVS